MTEVPAKTAPAKAPAEAAGSRLWLGGLACGAGVVLAAPSMVLAAVLLLPSLLAFVADRDPGRAAARSVAVFGIAFALAPALALWRGGGGMDACLDVLSNFTALPLAWSAQAGGWLLSELAPLLVRLALDAHAAARTRRLRALRRRYEEDWGIPPA